VCVENVRMTAEVKLLLNLCMPEFEAPAAG
jgi:hypothetical protein